MSAIATTIAACSSPDAATKQSIVDTAPATVTPDAPPRSVAHVVAPAESAAPSTGPGTTMTEVSATSRCKLSADPDPGERTLHVWHRFGGEVVPQWFSNQIKRYERLHPGVRVVLDEAPSVIAEQLAEISDRPPERRPDIVLGPAHAVRMQHDSALFIAPSECTGGEVPAALSGLLPAIRHHYSVDGTLWAAPYNVSAPVMMFDRARWRAAGLDPDDPPTTFDELFVAIEQLVASGQSAAGLALYDRSATWLVTQNAARDGTVLVEPNNGHTGREVESVLFELPGTVDLLEELQRLKADGKVLWLGLNEGDTADLFALVLGDVPSRPSAGITFHTSGSLGDIAEYLELDAFDDVDLGVAPIPGDDDGPAVGATVGGGSWWLVDRGDPAQAAAAWSLVDWLVQPERIAELAAFSGFVPTSPAAAADGVTVAAWAERPLLRVAYDELAVMPADHAANGWQVGPTLEVERQLELAAAFSIDAGEDPAEQLAWYAKAAETSLELYAAGPWD